MAHAGLQGIEGTVVFTGSTPELDDFTLRIVEGRYRLLVMSSHSHCVSLGPNNIVVTSGPHATTFGRKLGKSHLLGLQVPAGQVWRAKGNSYVSLITFILGSRKRRIPHAAHHEICHGSN